MNESGSCPVCGSAQLELFLTRSGVPVHQHLVMELQQAAREVQRGDLSLVICGECGFVHNQAFDLSLLQYGPTYDNAQTWSPAFAAYVRDRQNHLVNNCNVRNCHIVEVGSGDGSFIRTLVRDGDNTGTGFDPSYLGPAVAEDGRLTFQRRYYDGESSVKPDVVVCRHVIEHVPDPLSLLSGIRRSLIDSPNARVYFETPSVEWILQGKVIWDLFYEHCSYFSVDSITHAFEHAGFAVHQVQHVFGGQYLWLEASPSISSNEIGERADLLVNDARAFAADEYAQIAYVRDLIVTQSKQGPFSLWGAGAKGVTLANLVDPNAQLIDSIIDLNPNKQSRYTPGTGHLIVSPRNIAERGIRSALLMNPYYRTEVLLTLKDIGCNIEVL